MGWAAAGSLAAAVLYSQATYIFLKLRAGLPGPWWRPFFGITCLLEMVLEVRSLSLTLSLSLCVDAV